MQSPMIRYVAFGYRSWRPFGACSHIATPHKRVPRPHSAIRPAWFMPEDRGQVNAIRVAREWTGKAPGLAHGLCSSPIAPLDGG